MKIILSAFLLLALLPVETHAQAVSENAKRDLISQTNPIKEAGEFMSLPAENVVESKKKKKTVIQGGPQFTIKKIVIWGNTLFSSDQLLKDLNAAALEGKQMTFQDVQDFADKVTAYYQKHGYLNTYAYIPPQKSLDGVVTVKVFEVRVGHIAVVGNRWFSEHLFRDTMNIKTGDFFKLADLERGLNQINTRPDRSVQAFLEPGESPGTSDIELHVADRFPLHASFEYNLRGTAYTGRSRYMVHLTDNNLTGRGDIIEAALTAAEQGALYAQAIHYELPVAGSEDVVHMDFSDANSRLQKDLLPLDVKGRSVNIIPGYTRNFMDTGAMKLDGDLRYEIKDSKTDIQGNKLSFDRTRVVAGGPRMTFNDEGGRTMAGMDVHIGIPDFMGSLSRHDSLSSRLDSGGSFVYETFSASRVQKLPWELAFIAQANGQYSPVALPSLEQMYLGGMYSVRGYPESDSAGDMGFNFSQELRIPFYFIPQGWKVWGLKDKTWRNTLSFAVFIDEGRVFDHLREDTSSFKDRTLLGTGPGLRFYVSPDLNLQFDWGFSFGDAPSDNRHGRPDLSLRVGF